MSGSCHSWRTTVTVCHGPFIAHLSSSPSSLTIPIHFAVFHFQPRVAIPEVLGFLGAKARPHSPQGTQMKHTLAPGR